MAAGRVNVTKTGELSFCSKRLDAGRMRDGKGSGKNLDDEISPEGGVVMDIELPNQPPQKKRKSSPGLWGKEQVESEFNDSPAGMNSSLTCRTCSSDDQEPGQLEEEVFGRVPNILTSRWASDDDDDDMQDEDLQGLKEKKSKDTPESGVESDEAGELNNEKPPMETHREFNDILLPGTFEESSSNMCRECRSVSDYENLGKISEGSYGIVFRARDKCTGDLVALKKLKMGKEKEGFPLYYLREINVMSSFKHPSVLGVKEIVVDDSDEGFGNVYMVMEYMEHDLKALLQSRKQPFSQSEVKCLMLQLLEGVRYLHDNWVLHRDLKTANLLLNNEGDLKICDFGMSRQYGSPLKPYTELVVTLWYRAPELLLGAKEYSTAVDMWSVGCIMAELLAGKPLFDGRREIDQLKKIIETLGTPNEKIWPGYSQLPGAKCNFVHQPHNMLQKKFPRSSFTGSPVLSDLGLDLLSKLLTYNPEKRITAEDALNHAWFNEVPLPKSKEFMPTFPVSGIGMR